MENIQSEKEKKLEYPMARTFYCRTEIFCLIKSNFDELSFAILYLKFRMFKNLKLIQLNLKLFSPNTIIFNFFKNIQFLFVQSKNTIDTKNTFCMITVT